MAKGKGESPSQILTRHIVFLFALTLIGMHISLGYYYFTAEGSYYRHLIGYLSYVKKNVETMPIYRIQVVFQNILERDRGDALSIYRWGGSYKGYLCDGVYQKEQCNTSTKSIVKLEETYVRKFYYLPGKVTVGGVTSSKSVSFVVERCDATAGCPASAFASTPAAPTSFEIRQDATSKLYYLYINNVKELHDFQLYKISLGTQEPCLNEDVNSILPSYLVYSLYKVQDGCDRFDIVPNTYLVTQNTAQTAVNDGTISLNVKEVFLENEMAITLADIGKPYKDIPSTATPVNFNMYFLPKINYSSTITDKTSCVVDDDLSRVPHYSNYINQTGLTMFIIRQVFIAFLFPVPFVEMIMGFKKNPAVLIIGMVSKALLVLNMCLVIIEGAIVRYMYFNKTNLVNKIRNLGWKGCFNDSINQKFMKFPSVFSQTQDSYNYYVEVYMWIASVGLFILVLLFVKLGMDMCVKKRKYGEYDADPNEQNQPYDPTIAYVPYQDQQQFFSGDQYNLNGSQMLNMNGSQQLNGVSLVKTPSNRQKLLTTEKKNNLSTIKEYKNHDTSKGFNGSQKSQNYEMQVLQNSNQGNSSDEDEEN